MTSPPLTRRRSAPISPAPAPRGDQPRGTLASGNGGLGVGEGQVGRELGLAVGGLGPLAPERDRAWRGTKDPLCQKGEVRAQGASPRRRPALRPDQDEALDQRAREHNGWLGVQPATKGKGTQAAGRPQQRAGPGPRRRVSPGDHRPGEGTGTLVDAAGHPGGQVDLCHTTYILTDMTQLVDPRCQG
jgi:hypothetical protein